MRKYLSLSLATIIYSIVSTLAVESCEPTSTDKLDLEKKSLSTNIPTGDLLEQTWICSGVNGRANTIENLFQKMGSNDVAIVLEPYHWSYTSIPLDNITRLAQTADLVVDTIHGTMDKNGKQHIRDSFFVIHNTPSSRKLFSLVEKYETKKGELPVTGHPNALSSFISHYCVEKLPEVGVTLKVKDLQFPIPLAWQEKPLEKPLITSKFQRVKESFISTSPQPSPRSSVDWFSAGDTVIVNKKDPTDED